MPASAVEPASGGEQSGRNDPDAVISAVGLRTGGNDRGVEQFGSETIGQPSEVPYVCVVDGGWELDFQGRDTSVRSLKDEIDLAFAASGSQVRHAGLVGLGIDTHRQRQQRFEQCPEKGAVAGDAPPAVCTLEKCFGADAE